MPRVSIIIRTKNEEQWIKHCLKMIDAQFFRDFEVVLVDNGSEDATVAIAKRHGVEKIETISDYHPGDALNWGIAASSGEYVVCLSAHCVPGDGDWLSNLLEPFGNANVAGVYGRQLPVSFSSDSDKRDLLITFGLDRRVQVKDYFFHNANSAIRREVWEKIPFDDQTPNIEDRIWGKAVIEAGYNLVYQPEAAVYHHHGIHQNQAQGRAQTTVSVLEQVEPSGSVSGLPETMRPESAHIVAICPVLGDVGSDDELLAGLVRDLQTSRYVDTIYLFAESAGVAELARRVGAEFIERPADLQPPDKSLEDALQYAFLEIEARGEFPDAIVYANYLFPCRPKGFFDDLATELQYKGLDTVFGGYPDFSNYWIGSVEEGYRIVGDGMKPRSGKHPMYRALNGLGTIVAASQIRRGALIGEAVGIITIRDETFARKISPPGA
jgi:hypothetical protein